MWIPAFALMLGIVVGMVFRLEVPADYARYTAMAILAGLDSIFGAARAQMQGEYNNQVFISGLVVNMLLAGLLTFLGDRLGVELYIAAIVAFGARLFDNLAVIRRQLLRRFQDRQGAKAMSKA